MYKKILIICLFVCNVTIGQFNEISFKINENELLESKFASYVYTGNNINDKHKLKIEIYSFFDASISLNVDDYDPNIQSATNFFFVIYKRTANIPSNLIILENHLNKDIFPALRNQENNIIATVRYSISGNDKEIIFYENKIPVKHYYFNNEETIDSEFVRNFKF